MVWLVAPLLQLNLGFDEKAIGWSYKQGVRVTSLTGEMRRRLLDSAKATNCTEYTLHELNAATALIWVAMPEPGPFPAASQEISVGFFRAIADTIASRLLDGLRLLDYIPLHGNRKQFCWFATSESADIDAQSRFQSIDPTSNSSPRIFLFDEKSEFRPVYRDWKPMEPDYLDPDWNGENPVHEGTGVSALMLLEMFQDRLLSICGLEKLRAIFIDPEKWEEYNAAAKKEVKRRTLEFLEEYTDKERAEKHEVEEPRTFSVPGEYAAKWQLAGWIDAFTREIEKLNKDLYGGGSAALFPRAFGIFSNAMTLRPPSRFVLVSTSLEALLSGSGTSDLTYKLASRVAWLLEPKDGPAPMATFKNVNDLYSFRSKIIHGSSFEIDKYESNEEQILELTRYVFGAVLSSDDAWNGLSAGAENAANDYLKRLSLGAI